LYPTETDWNQHESSYVLTTEITIKTNYTSSANVL